MGALTYTSALAVLASAKLLGGLTVVLALAQLLVAQATPGVAGAVLPLASTEA